MPKAKEGKKKRIATSAKKANQSFCERKTFNHKGIGQRKNLESFIFNKQHEDNKFRLGKYTLAFRILVRLVWEISVL